MLVQSTNINTSPTEGSGQTHSTQFRRLQGAQMMYNYDWANPNRESVINNAIDEAAKAGVPKEELDEVRKWKNSWQMDMSNYR